MSWRFCGGVTSTNSVAAVENENDCENRGLYIVLYLLFWLGGAVWRPPAESTAAGVAAAVVAVVVLWRGELLRGWCRR